MTGRGPLRRPVKTTPTTAELQFATDNRGQQRFDARSSQHPG
jgi:hypothetical protein